MEEQTQIISETSNIQELRIKINKYLELWNIRLNTKQKTSYYKNFLFTKC